MSERQTATGQRGTELRLELELERRRGGHGGPASLDPTDLAVCPCCLGHLVYPVTWAPASDRQWHVALRCPECEWHGDGEFGQDMLDRFDETLDDATQSVVDDLQLLTRANMEEQIDRFARAIEADLILPEDF
jgi:hypothetical protein